MSDKVPEVIRAAILLYVVLYLVKAGKKRKELCRKGWGFVVAGFGLLLFGSIMDVTDNFESLNRFVFVGDTPTEAFLEKMVGFMGGFAVLAIGLIRWIPTITGVHRTKQLNEELEKEITGRKRMEEALRTSEDKYKSMFENMVPGSCFDELIYKDGIATDYRILDVNPSYETILGIPRSEVIGKLASEVYKTDNIPFLDIYARVSETGVPELYEAYFPPANKILSITTTCPEKGKFSNTFLDITELKRAEDALRASEEKVNTLFASLPQLVWTCRVDGPCDYLSPQWVKYTGIPEAQQLGYGWLEQIHPDDREPTMAVWKNVVESGCDFHVEFRIRRHDGDYRWFYTHALLLHDLDGRPTKWYGSNTDITETKQAVEMLRSSEHQLNAMFNSSPVGMMLINENTEVTRINVYLTDRIGKDSEELLGLQPGEIFNCANAHNDKGGCGKGEACCECPTRGAVTQVLKTGQPIYNADVNMPLLTDGQIKNTWLSFSLVQIEIEERPHVMTAFVDITERKQAEEEKGEITAEMERMNRLMTGREMRVIEMKKEVNALLAELGKEPEYKSVLEETDNKVTSPGNVL